MSDVLSPRQLAEALGVSESSVRRWADGGLIRTTRTSGGHRRIARTEAIRFIRESSTEVVRPDLLKITEPPSRRFRARAFASQGREFLSALKKGQTALAVGLVRRMYLNGVSVAEICDGAVREAMHRIGELWPRTRRGIFIEHRATMMCLEALSRLQTDFRPVHRRRPVAIGAAPASDPYLLPTMMCATTLADAGFACVNLGADMPLDVLARSAIDSRARLVWVTCTSTTAAPCFADDVRKTAARLRKENIALVVGGQGIHQPIANSRLLHRFDTMSELATFATQFLS